MIAIEVRYIAPTNTLGSRYVAETCNGHRKVIHAADNLDAAENADNAAVALCRDQGWNGDLARGGSKRGWVYVFTPPRGDRLVSVRA